VSLLPWSIVWCSSWCENATNGLAKKQTTNHSHLSLSVSEYFVVFISKMLMHRGLDSKANPPCKFAHKIFKDFFKKKFKKFNLQFLKNWFSIFLGILYIEGQLGGEKKKLIFFFGKDKRLEFTMQKDLNH